MAKVGKHALQQKEMLGLETVKEGERALLKGFAPSEGKEQQLHHPHLLLDFAIKTKDVLVAKGVVEEVKKRLLQFKGESKADKDKAKVEKDAELRVEEKCKAAAWAWYQHGNSGSNGSPAVLTPPPNPLIVQRPAPTSGNARKASRFKTEAQKVGSAGGRVESEPHWDFENSLFDSYELKSVSKQIDHAFHEDYEPLAHAAPSPAPAFQAAKLTRSHSLRVSFPRSLCRSISDVITHEEMALGHTRKRDTGCSKEKTRRDRSSGSGGWSFRRISKAIHFFISVPASDSQSHEQHHHEHHHHHHQHEHEHHHHHHFSVRIKDPCQYSKSFRGIERVKGADLPFPTYPQAR